jgi:RNA polymerase primary sigma factor
VRRNLGLVRSIVRRYNFSKLNDDDLVQEGSIGLLSAIKKFDVERGTCFSTYAGYWIRAYVTRSIERSPLIRPAFGYREKLIRGKRMGQLQAQKLGRELTRVEFAELTGIKLEKVEEMQACAKPALQLHDLIYSDGLAISEILHDDEQESVHELIEESSCRTLVEGAIARLPERNALIMRLWINGQNLSQIAKRIGVSRERVRQVIAMSLERIRRGKYRSQLQQMWAA